MNLSNELLLQIIYEIGRPVDLHHFSQVTPSIRVLCKASLKACCAKFQYTGLKSIRNLLRVLLTYPELGTYVTHVDLEEPRQGTKSLWTKTDWAAQGENQASDISLFVQGLKRAGFPEYQRRDYIDAFLPPGRCAHSVIRALDHHPSDDEFRGSKEYEHKGVQVALLMTLLPNLQHFHNESPRRLELLALIISGSINDLQGSLGLRRAASATPSARPFENLSQLSYCYGQPAGTQGAMFLHDIYPFFHLPNLTKFDGYRISSEDYSSSSSPSPFPLSAIPSCSSGITALSFMQSAIKTQTLAEFVRIAKALETFHYSYEGFMILEPEAIEERNYSSFDINHLLLKYAQDSLTDLRLDAESLGLGWADDQEVVPLGSLRG